MQSHKLGGGAIAGIIIAVLAGIILSYIAARRYMAHQQEKSKTRHSILKTYADEYSQEDFINPVLEASARAPKSVRSARGSRPSRVILAAADADPDAFNSNGSFGGHMPVDNEVVMNPMHVQFDESGASETALGLASDLRTVPLETPGAAPSLRQVSKQLFHLPAAAAADMSPMAPALLADHLADRSVSSPLSAFSTRHEAQYEALLNPGAAEDSHEYSDVSVLVDDEGAVESLPAFEPSVPQQSVDPAPAVAADHLHPSLEASSAPVPALSPVAEDASDEFDRLAISSVATESDKRIASTVQATPSAPAARDRPTATRTVQTDTERPCGRSPPTPDTASLQSPSSNSLESLDISPIMKPTPVTAARAQSPQPSSPSSQNRRSVIHMSALGASALLAREPASTPVSSKSINEIDIDSPSPLTAAKPPPPETAKKKRSNPPSPIKRPRGSRPQTPVRSRDTTPLSTARSDAPASGRLDSARKGGFLEDTEASRQRRRERNAGDSTARSDCEDETPRKGSPKKSIVEDIERARWPEALQGDGHRFHKPLAEPRAIYPVNTKAAASVPTTPYHGSLGAADGDMASPLDSTVQSKRET